MGRTRTKEYEAEYRDFLSKQDKSKCDLCDGREPIAEFEHWKIIKNIFPWNLIAKEQHMAIPKIHKSRKELTKEEKEEYEKIKDDYIEKNYEVIAEATEWKKSIPGHFHVHLIILKD